MSQQDLYDYVMNTPHNTNPAILKQKIKETSGASSWNDLKDKPFGVEHTLEFIIPDSLNINEYYDFGDRFGIDRLLFYRVKTWDIMPQYYNPTVFLRGYNGNFHEDKNATLREADVSEYGIPDTGVIRLYELSSFEQQDETTFDTLYAFLFASITKNELGLPEGLFVACLSFKYFGSDLSAFSKAVLRLVDERIYYIDEKYLPAPKLLGELVVDNVNTSLAEYDSSREFNEEFQTQVANLFKTIKNTPNIIFAKIEIATAVSTDTVNTCFGCAALGYPDCIQIGRDSLGISIEIDRMYADSPLLKVINIHPMTIKVYAV